MEQCLILLGHHSNRFCGEWGFPRALSGGSWDICPLPATCAQAQIWGSAGPGRSGDTPCHMMAGSKTVYLRADRKQTTVMKATLISSFTFHVITAHRALIVHCKLHTSCQWRLQRSRGHTICFKIPAHRTCKCTWVVWIKTNTLVLYILYMLCYGCIHCVTWCIRYVSLALCIFKLSFLCHQVS